MSSSTEEEKLYWPSKASATALLLIVGFSILILLLFVVGMYRHPALDVLLLAVMALAIYYAGVRYYKMFMGG